ncbi:hypothetical protein XELAEV_18046606mg [Xenopus laevis]|uniref:Uncharacterized protein n=1 Tax=Xenopus laevis TaxID=8355 RepID=A0A974BTV1_XENLA|nr:hypothetical protein XELAEV_18046606mg [Xenopus laevis]
MIKCPCSLADIEMAVEQVKDRLDPHKNVINISNESTILILHCRTLRNIISHKIDGNIDRNTLRFLKKAEWVYDSKAVSLNGTVISI